MLIESIKITNFLPFRETQFVEFSTDPEHNVTIVMGDNGSGKTALAQAFEWCLYGKTSYEDNRLLNAETRDRLSPGSSTDVNVEICLKHENISYTITRKQRYERKINGEMAKPGDVDFCILYKDEGESKQVALRDQNATINKLLANELSHYFFFDGEHVKNMRNEIESGKSAEFAEAVKSILGLRHIANALEHLKASNARKNSVERTFKNQYKADSDNTIEQNNKNIIRYSGSVEKLEDEIDNLQAEENAANDRVKKYESLLAENQQSEQAMKDVNRCKDMLDLQQEEYSKNLFKVFNYFKKKQYRFFSERLMADACQELSNEDKIDKGVPGVNQETIEYLLNRKRCICGTDLTDGSVATAALYELLKYVPPNSIGSSISEFIKSCETRREESDDLAAEVKQAYSTYRESQEKVELAEKSLDAANEFLASLNQVDVKSLRENLDKARQDEKSAREQLGVKRHHKLQYKQNIDRLEKQNDEVAKQNSENKEIAECLEYTEYIYKFLSDDYTERERKVKQELQHEVNSIFEEIYDGDLYLEFDDNYGVTVKVNGISSSDENWKTSSAQTLAVILAFIAGILKIARENITSDDVLAEGSTYPLVMDAPLSDFDTTRIKTICTVLPTVAEQVIILIKDTDGNLAEKNFGSKIGRRYLIRKLSDYNSEIKER